MLVLTLRSRVALAIALTCKHEREHDNGTGPVRVCM